MLGLILVGVVALVLVTYVILPLFIPMSHAPETDDQPDPVEQSLKEERDALYRAIAETDARTDLTETERGALRARYAAKAAAVLKALDLQEVNQTEPLPRPSGRAARLPAGGLLLVILIIPSVVLLGNYVFPRVGGATVTTAFQEQLDAGRNIAQLERAVRNDPSEENLLALADAYWRQLMTLTRPSSLDAVSTAADVTSFQDKTAAVYRRVEEEVQPVPAVAYQRLGWIEFQAEGHVEQGMRYLELAREADPNDLDTLYTLGEAYYYQGRLNEAADAWENFLAAPGGETERELVEPKLQAARTLAPLQAAAERQPNEGNLMALADAFWELDARDQAAGVYYHVVTELNAQNPKAIRRLGITMFFNGNNEQAALALEVAKELEPDVLETLLFLGNAYFSMNQLEQAVSTWRQYVEVAGGPENAGRVPELIRQAEERLTGQPADASAVVNADPSSIPAGETRDTSGEGAKTLSGEELFAANCATCHGATGAGGVGPNLAGNPRSANEQMVENTIRYGRGMMPGFSALLSDEEIRRLTDYVTERANP